MGRISGLALAAVNVSQITLFIVVSLGMGITVGSGVLIAQAIGAKEKDKAEKTLGQAFVLAALLAVGFTIIALGGFIALLGISIIVYVSIPYKSDFDTFAAMRRDTLAIAEEKQLEPLQINDEFTDYRVDLNPMIALMFKRGDLGLKFETFQSEKLERFSISQMEIGKGSGIFFDFTFLARPVASVNAPVFHCDILRPFPGTEGALYMDFYTLNGNTDLTPFFGEELQNIENAKASVQKYWKNEGFGELTTYMDSYKSPYRIEILEPKSKDKGERRAYFDAARQCYLAYLAAYLRSLENAPFSASSETAEENRRSFLEYLKNLYDNDIVVKLGYMIFDESDFDRKLIKTAQ